MASYIRHGTFYYVTKAITFPPSDIEMEKQHPQTGTFCEEGGEWWKCNGSCISYLADIPKNLSTNKFRDWKRILENALKTHLFALFMIKIVFVLRSSLSISKDHHFR